MLKNNIKKTCRNCEFNFKKVCANTFYGENIKDLEFCCDGWNIDFKTYSLCVEWARKYYMIEIN